jgi:hypothetical protein
VIIMTSPQRACKVARQGYVLVMTLVLITLVGIALSQVAQQGLELVHEANTKQESVQQKWALHGLRLAVLDRADEILAAQAMRRGDDLQPWPEPHELALELPLGKLRFRLLLADEDAKAHLRHSDKAHDSAQLRRTISLLAPELSAMSVSLRPYAWSPTAAGSRQIESWGQVFEQGVSADASGTARLLRDGTHSISCWGGDRLNLRRAPDRVVDAVLQDHLSTKELKLLMELRRKRPGALPLDELLQQLGLGSEEYFELRQRVSEHGTSYTLWIESDSRGAARFQLLVRNPGGSGSPRRVSFEW